ncbi:MAG: AAA family ATPase [Oscillospiraceae bacterium]|nr:AAA family ATPase [Oscillospiraceae bacterium]
MGTAIVITSGKGGTGKTSTAAGVASCLAAMGKRVLCLDADVGLRNLDLTLGMTEQAMMSFADVILGRCPLERAAVEHPTVKNLFLLTAPAALPEGVDEAGMAALMDQIRAQFDYCIIDCPAGVDAGFRLATCAADRALLVSNADYAALRDGLTAVYHLQRRDIPIHLVVNRVRPRLLRKLRLNIDDAMDDTGLPLLGVIPEDELVPLSAARGVPVITAGNRGAAVAYYHIARRLTGERVRLMRI